MKPARSGPRATIRGCSAPPPAGWRARRIEKQSSDFVRVREDDSQAVVFKPVMEVAPIRTQTTDPKQVEVEMTAIREFVENHLVDRIRNADMWKGWQEYSARHSSFPLTAFLAVSLIVSVCRSKRNRRPAAIEGAE